MPRPTRLPGQARAVPPRRDALWPRRQAACAVVDRPQLSPVAERLLEVVAEDLLDLDDPLAGPLLDPDDEALVQVGPHLLGDPGVRGIADQLVTEAVPLLAGHDRTVRADQLLADERRQQPRDLGAGVRRGQICDRAGPETLARHRRPLQRLALLGGSRSRRAARRA